MMSRGHWRRWRNASLKLNSDHERKRRGRTSPQLCTLSPMEVWQYEVSGKQILLQWFSYRKRNRERPIIGDRRAPSSLGDIQPDHWLPEYTTDLLNVLNVLGLLVELEPKQADLLEKICSGPLISGDELDASGALQIPTEPKKTASNGLNLHLFES